MRWPAEQFLDFPEKLVRTDPIKVRSRRWVFGVGSKSGLLRITGSAVLFFDKLDAIKHFRQML